MTNNLKLAVVGHTNTGKTSLMRTLLRDTQFGEVKNAAATTRHVEEAWIGEWVRLYDTPGLEDAGGVLDWLEQNTSNQIDGIERLQQFLASPAAAQEFSQEAKVLRQLLQSDCALYVIDAREPVLPKYKDELTVLSWCAKPIMPVFNFTAGRDLSDWQTMLARRVLHVSSAFDTVAFDFNGEIQLWDNLATMLPERSLLDTLIAHRRYEWARLDTDARLLIAHFLLNVAAYRQTFATEAVLTEKQAEMQTMVRQAERHLHKQLLDLYQFYNNELRGTDWAMQAFRQDPFDSELLLQYGIRTGKGLATGAAVGLGFDVLTAGLSLGVGTVVGSLIGSIIPNIQTISDKITGTQTLWVDSAALTVLAARACELLAMLQARGHAAQDELALRGEFNAWAANKLPDELQKARRKTEWSQWNSGTVAAAQKERAEAAQRLAERLRF